MNDFSPLTGPFLELLDLTQSATVDLAKTLADLRTVELPDISEALFATALAELAAAKTQYQHGHAFGAGRGLVKGLLFSRKISSDQADALTRIFQDSADRLLISVRAG